ncbi:hypothetical protein HBI58_010470 [Parastagonospora nodorum]|nr:hypothetical protein HBI58_010470 [Parastagonospora nodorum]
MGQISTGAVVTASERRGRPKTVQQGNREWTTVIQGVNATGWAILPFIIFKGRHHLLAWYKEEDLPHNWVIAVSKNGWTTNELGLQWLKHFDEHTKRRVTGAYRLLIIDGYESHDSLEFQQYCKDNKIITICMPPHSSHLLQPLDVGCFAPLKKAHVDSSPTSIVEAFEKVSKGAAIIAHKLVLAQKEIAELRAANKAATRRKSHKRKRVQEEGTLTVEDGLRRTTLKEFGARSDGKKAKKQVRAGAGEPSQRRCGRCNETRHNARTCKKAVEVDSE